MATIFPWLGLHFCVAAVGTWWARRYAVARDLVDQPGERRSHVVATPRGGGIAIVVSLLLASVWLAWLFPSQRVLLAVFVAGMLAVAAVGWWDDHRPLSPWSRLLVHALAGAGFSMALLYTTGSRGQAMFAFLAVLVLVNVWNFMDGIDGLAATQAAVCAVAFLFWLPGPWSWLAAALLAACCGFLPFNFPRARIFLGDVGSGVLGFALAALLSVSAIEQDGLVLMLIPMAAFLVDASFTLSSRILCGERWWTPHVSHVYQRAARRFGHVSVTSMYWMFSTVTLLLISLASNARPGPEIWLVAWYALALALWGWARKQLK